MDEMEYTLQVPTQYKIPHRRKPALRRQQRDSSFRHDDSSSDSERGKEGKFGEMEAESWRK